MVGAVERGQRAVIGKQVDGQRGAARLERVGDEAGRIDVVVPDHEHTHHAQPPRGSYPAWLSMLRRSTTVWTSMSLPVGGSKIWVCDPTVTVTLPS